MHKVFSLQKMQAKVDLRTSVIKFCQSSLACFDPHPLVFIFVPSLLYIAFFYN
jgi:hypothetical protein